MESSSDGIPGVITTPVPFFIAAEELSRNVEPDGWALARVPTSGMMSVWNGEGRCSPDQSEKESSRTEQVKHGELSSEGSCADRTQMESKNRSNYTISSDCLQRSLQLCLLFQDSSLGQVA
jgi:hypothetical protein